MVYVFVDDVMKNVKLQFSEQKKINGMSANVYKVHDSVVASSKRVPENLKYYQYYEGTMNLTSVY